MYSDMSKRTSSMPSCRASCLVTSVLPTPVGPANRKLPIGLSGLPRPERASLIADARVSMAGSWPKITIFRLRSRCCSTSLSDEVTCLAGMRAILAMIVSISSMSIRSLRWPSGSSRWRAPASSITSMALSGRSRSPMCLTDRSTAACSASSA